MDKITESDSNYRNLENKSSRELLNIINTEDHRVPEAVQKIIPHIEALVNIIVDKMEHGGRLFYIGAGTSGRLGILDASECPPTFGVPHDMVIGLIAGGDRAIRKAVEHAEDDMGQAWKDLQQFGVDDKDVVIGIAASGTTPYVLGGINDCNKRSIITGGITCNPGSPLAKLAQYPIVPVVGPEVVTGSTRMKSGTAQKLVLNMISTTVMIKLGRVEDHRMVDMQLSNDKLWARAIRILEDQLGISKEEAKKLLEKEGSVRQALRSME